MTNQMQFGDLFLTFTTKFQWRYDDHGTRASGNGAFYHPIAQDGFFPLGSLAVDNYDAVNGNYWAICVKAASSAPNATAHPIRYELIWTDSGTRGDNDGSCWRPIPPDGYVALGDVFVSGYDSPSLNDIVCIRKDLTVRGKIAKQIYNDSGSGGDRDLGIWSIQTSGNIDFTDKNGIFAANTFVANANYAIPVDSPSVNCLKLPFPVKVTEAPILPKLMDVNMPSGISGRTVDRIVTVPFTAINDVDLNQSLQWQVEKTPFYTVERQAAYKLEIYNYNTTSESQTHSKSVMSGVSQSNSTTFSQTTGISVAAEGGVSFLGTGGKVTATITVELGFEQSTVIEEFTETTILRQLTTKPGSAAALWNLNYTLSVVRADQTHLSHPLTFDVAAFIESEFVPSS